VLAAHGADPNLPNAQGRTPLFAAAMDGDRSTAQTLLSHGASVNATDNWGATPLHWAAARGSVETAQLLLFAGADTALATHAGVTAGQAAQASMQNVTAFGLPYSPPRVEQEQDQPFAAYPRDPEEAARRRYEELLWVAEAYAANGGLPEDGSIPLDRAYANITLIGPDRDLILGHIREMSHGAYISPTVDGFTVVYDTACAPERASAVWSRTADLAATFDCVAMGVLARGDGLWQYRLYVGGELTDQYSSFPDEGDPLRRPTGGSAQVLCEAFGVPDAEAQVEAILRRARSEDDGPVFEILRHRELAMALGMPLFAVGSGYNRIEAQHAIPEAPRDLLELLANPPSGYPGMAAA